ncbi:hypothetical protein Van01_19240 [Micromonospora andamanensis]|uniref:Uncharacterized protein n=1 Tax=Micromonospora andamanensis TaxID=1287068 RepID=A0ABQ4HSV3_9ACTN|nr:hypothetical protein Van01_19240 [Micromonospora andamanensis]
MKRDRVLSAAEVQRLSRPLGSGDEGGHEVTTPSCADAGGSSKSFHVKPRGVAGEVYDARPGHSVSIRLLMLSTPVVHRLAVFHVKHWPKTLVEPGSRYESSNPPACG